jgi:hypothetical protein
VGKVDMRSGLELYSDVHSRTLLKSKECVEVGDFMYSHDRPTMQYAVQTVAGLVDAYDTLTLDPGKDQAIP